MARSEPSVPLLSRHFTLKGGEHHVAYGPAMLVGATAQPFMKRARYVSYLEISHGGDGSMASS